MSKRVTPAILGIALISFFVPWVSVSCQGQTLMSLSGVQLVTGTTVQTPDYFGNAQRKAIPAEKTVIVVFLATLAGLGASLLRGEQGAKVTAASATGGLVMLLIFKYSSDNAVLKEGNGLLKIDYGLGMYLTGLMLLCAIGVTVYSMRSSPSPTTGPAVRSPADGVHFCSTCGARNGASDAFCRDCGQKLSPS